MLTLIGRDYGVRSVVVSGVRILVDHRSSEYSKRYVCSSLDSCFVLISFIGIIYRCFVGISG